mmetsp:Transcript_4240/g.8110  ORF Transcript_4240/g.8110 Transcript_4240/m.8110 type:complete len:683 (-) Transcript_4240:3860-5908(-)
MGDIGEIVTTRNSNKDHLHNEKMKYHAIGFGSNYFHQFGDCAVPLSGVHYNSANLDGIGAASSTDGSLSAYNCSFDHNDTSFAQGTECNIVPQMYVFPLHPDQTQFMADTKTAKRQANGFLNFFRRRRRQRKNKKQDVKQDSFETLKQEVPSVSSCDDSFELPYASDTKPVEQLEVGLTHVTFTTEKGIYVMGTVHGVTIPYPTSRLAKVPLKCTQIACGRRHSLALFEGKVTMSWGGGYFGQLGHGIDYVYCEQPTIVERLMPRYVGGEVVSVAAGGMQSAVIVASNPLEWKNRSNAKDVETRVFWFGSNKHGQCAIEEGPCNAIAFPTLMIDIFHPENKKRVSFVSVALGKSHSVGLTHYGEIYSWGSNALGRCGHGDRSGSMKSALKQISGTSLPKRVDALKNVKIVQIDAGDSHTLALSGSGRVFSWGGNNFGQLGVGHSLPLASPRLVADLEFSHIARGFAKGEISEAAETPFRDDGDAFKNLDTKEQVDVGDTDNIRNLGAALAPIHYPSSPHKKAVQKAGDSDPVPPKIVSVYAAGAYSAALSSSGDLYTWGCGESSQLGHPMQRNDVPHYDRPSDNPNQEYNLRTRDVQSFDSRLNVLLPRRVECLRHLGLRVENVATSSNFLLTICSRREKDITDDEYYYLMGRTLFDLEVERREKGLDRIRLLRVGHSNDEK